MACPCCNNALLCGTCSVSSTLYGTITTASGAPFRDIIFSSSGLRGVLTEPMPDSFEMVYAPAGSASNDVPCGPACANVPPPGCPGYSPPPGGQFPLAAWRSTDRFCYSELDVFETLQTGRTSAPYTFNCSGGVASLAVSAHTMGMTEYLNTFGSLCQFLTLSPCTGVVVGSVPGRTIFASFNLSIQSCDPFLAVGVVAAGTHGLNPFRGFFAEDFTITVTE